MVNKDIFDSAALPSRSHCKIQNQVENNRREFVREKSLHLFAGSWNVNGRTPDPKVDITQWLKPQSLPSNQPVDVYMLGFQEVQALSGVDVFRTDIAKGNAWRRTIQKALGSDYEKVAERQLVGIIVFVFVRQNHIPFLSNVQLSYAATGFFNAVGNKGGVAARFTLYDRTISCVACHLAAHTAFVERRNQDFTDVVRKAVFLPVENQPYLEAPPTVSWNAPSIEDDSDSMLVRRSTIAVPFEPPPRTSSISGFPAAAGTASNWLGSVASVAATAFSDMSSGANTTVLNDPNAVNVLDHDVVFWLGDLNYRLEASSEEVLEWIKTKNWDALYKSDQLQKQMRQCSIFTGFKEGPLRFPPTYKLERFSNDYACDETGQVKRLPSYTDRILWRIGTLEDDPKGMPDLRLTTYSSAENVFSSDHRPVYALFTMKFGVEDMGRRKDVEAKVIENLDDDEPTQNLTLQLSSSTIDFGDVFFERPCERQVSIRNVGNVKGTFSVSIPDASPKWLIFDASKWKNVEVLPGKAVALRLRALVTAADGVAESLCNDGCSMDVKILVETNPGQICEKLQLKGRYVATTLGLSLEMLCMLEHPVLSLRRKRDDKAYSQGGEARRNENEAKKDPEHVPLSVPKELWLLVDSLLRIDDEGGDLIMNRSYTVFSGNADEAQIQRVLAFIDHAEPIPSELSVDAVGMCLIRVLEKMNGSIVPEFAYKRAIETGHTEDVEAVKAVVDLLPPVNANAFWYLVGLLCQIECVYSRSDSGRAIVSLFAKVMLRPKRGNRGPRDEKSKTAFLMSAIRYQNEATHPSSHCSVIIDVSNPSTHPRRLNNIIK